MHAPKQIQDSVSNLGIYACLFGVTVVNIKKDGDAKSDMLFELCSEGGTVKACLSQKWARTKVRIWHKQDRTSFA